MTKKPLPESISLSEAVRHDDTPARDVEALGCWQIGVAGNCNIVEFDGDNVRGIARVPPENAQWIVDTHNRQIREQAETIQQKDVEIARLTNCFNTSQSRWESAEETIRQLREDVERLKAEAVCFDTVTKCYAEDAAKDRKRAEAAEAQSPAAVRAALEAVVAEARNRAVVITASHGNCDFVRVIDELVEFADWIDQRLAALPKS